LFEQISFMTSHTQFLYNTLGMPMVTKGALKPLTKLTSYPMNYTYKYLGELNHQMLTGKPTWVGNKDMW